MDKEKWKALSAKQRWDVIVALRGPDSMDGGTLKWFTNAPIRYAMQSILRPEGGSAMINEDLQMVVVPDSYWGGGIQQALTNITTDSLKADKLVPGFFRFDGHHFVQHVGEAASILQLPVLMVPYQAYWDAMQHRRTAAAKEIILAVEAEHEEGYRGSTLQANLDRLKKHLQYLERRPT